MRRIELLFLFISLFSAESIMAYTCTNDSLLKENLPVKADELRNPHYDIVVARVVEIRDGEGATNERPPTVLLQIREVLRGDVKPGAYDAVWQGAMRVSDRIDPEDYRSGVRPEWHECPLNTPPAGTDIIAFVRAAEEGSSRLLIKETKVYRSTNHNRSIVSRNSAPAERQGKAQRLIFFALVAFPVAGIVLIFTRLKGVGILLSVSVFPLYVYYESGISIYSNIRLDRLLVWPALVLALISVIIFMSRYPRRNVELSEGSIDDKNES